MIAKKNLVAAAALMAVAAAAQAQVKLYGALDYFVGSVETAHTKNDSNRKTVVDSGGMMTSFFGIAGSEDLGGGLKAEFAIESFLAGDTGATLANNAGKFWGRASNIALSGGFGKVAIGQYDNPLFTSGYTYNPFGSSMLLSPTMRHLGYLGQTGISGAGVGFDTGWVNSLTYETPVFSGLQGFAQYAPKESTTSATGNNYTVAAKYDMGPFSAMVTYVKGGVSDTACTTTGSSTVCGYTASEKVMDLGASYDLGAAKVFAQFTSVKDTTNDNKDKIYQIGVSAPLSDKATVMASYGELKNTAGSDKTSDKVLSIGYDYLLSKRTDVYGAFMHNSQTDLETGMSLIVGLKHAF
jgi:predicted porin